MFSVVIPITELSDFVLNNIRVLSVAPQVKQILLVNISTSMLELKRKIPKVEVIQLYNMDTYQALSQVTKEFVEQSNVIILDNNIQVNSKFIQKLTTHYAAGHIYTFKVNDIFPNNSVIIDKRLGNKLSPSMYTIMAVAFEKQAAANVNFFSDGDLIDFVWRMADNGVKTQQLSQVLVHRVVDANSFVAVDTAKKRRQIPKPPPNAAVARSKRTTVIKPNVNGVPVPLRQRDTKPVEAGDIKYSILMPYYNRHVLLNNTLKSFKYWYKYRNDFEVIIIEDSKNANDKALHTKLFKITNKFKDFPIRVIKNEADAINPACHFNRGVEVAKGDYIILTNPDGIHLDDILNGFDRRFRENDNYYVVCACINGDIIQQNIDTDYKDMKVYYSEWYQHTVHRNANFHFCSCMSKDNYLSFGGFDEDYNDGYAVEDVDFLERINVADHIIMCPADDLLTVHQSHGIVRPTDWYPLHIANKRLFVQKWGKQSGAVHPKPVLDRHYPLEEVKKARQKIAKGKT